MKKRDGEARAGTRAGDGRITKKQAAGGTLTGATDVRKSAMLALAKKYIKDGWLLIPLDGKVPQKDPATRRRIGVKSATDDLNVVRGWLETFDDMNLGGTPPEGMAVVDVDIYKCPEKLKPVAAELRALGGPVQRSGGGGVHVLVRGDVPQESELCAHAGVKDGIEVKAHSKGYVVLAPSVHPDTGKPYEWERDLLARPPKLPATWHNGREYAPHQSNPKKAKAIPDLWNEREARKVRRSLAVLDVEELPYKKWIKVGQALHSADPSLDGPAFEAWLRWSEKDGGLDRERKPRFKGERDLRNHWKTFGQQRGVTLATLYAMAKDAKPQAQEGDADGGYVDQDGEDVERRPIEATAFVIEGPKNVPPRDWLYRHLMIRKYVSATFGAGARGKSILTLKDCVSMAVGFDLDTKAPHRRGPLRVWYVNVEDDPDEIKRRLEAICSLYEITNKMLKGRLHFDTDREGRYVVVNQSREGLVVERMVVDRIVGEICRRNIDVFVVDPLVHMHSVNENDNTAMGLVVGQLRRVAEEGDCAVHAIHHVRKGSNGEVIVDDGRGATALSCACRAIRTLTPMNAKEATAFGIPDSERDFYGYANPSGKPNLAPPVNRREWYRLHSVDLDNATDLLQSDSVGVPMAWTPPEAAAGVPLEEAERVYAAIEAVKDPLKEARADPQAKEGWIGVLVCKALGWGIESDRERVKALVKQWVKDGVLAPYNVQSRANRNAPCLRLGPNAVRTSG